MATVEFDVPDLHCGACRREVEDALDGLPGLHRVVVDLRSRRVTARLDDAVTDPAAVAAALTAAGFPPRLLTLQTDP